MKNLIVLLAVSSFMLVSCGEKDSSAATTSAQGALQIERHCNTSADCDAEPGQNVVSTDADGNCSEAFLADYHAVTQRYAKAQKAAKEHGERPRASNLASYKDTLLSCSKACSSLFKNHPEVACTVPNADPEEMIKSEDQRDACDEVKAALANIRNG